MCLWWANDCMKKNVADLLPLMSMLENPSQIMIHKRVRMFLMSLGAILISFFASQKDATVKKCL